MSRLASPVCAPPPIIVHPRLHPSPPDPARPPPRKLKPHVTPLVSKPGPALAVYVGLHVQPFHPSSWSQGPSKERSLLHSNHQRPWTCQPSNLLPIPVKVKGLSPLCRLGSARPRASGGRAPWGDRKFAEPWGGHPSTHRHGTSTKRKPNPSSLEITMEQVDAITTRPPNPARKEAGVQPHATVKTRPGP